MRRRTSLSSLHTLEDVVQVAWHDHCDRERAERVKQASSVNSAAATPLAEVVPEHLEAVGARTDFIVEQVLTSSMKSRRKSLAAELVSALHARPGPKSKFANEHEQPPSAAFRESFAQRVWKSMRYGIADNAGRSGSGSVCYCVLMSCARHDRLDVLRGLIDAGMPAWLPALTKPPVDLSRQSGDIAAQFAVYGFPVPQPLDSSDPLATVKWARYFEEMEHSANSKSSTSFIEAASAILHLTREDESAGRGPLSRQGGRYGAVRALGVATELVELAFELHPKSLPLSDFGPEFQDESHELERARRVAPEVAATVTAEMMRRRIAQARASTSPVPNPVVGDESARHPAGVRRRARHAL